MVWILFYAVEIVLLSAIAVLQGVFDVEIDKYILMLLGGAAFLGACFSIILVLLWLTDTPLKMVAKGGPQSREPHVVMGRSAPVGSAPAQATRATPVQARAAPIHATATPVETRPVQATPVQASQV